ncbi:unnamed protein product [Paramecium octaurelia]|uniref:Transmembrane protein n=1 Tax=Paramecium octaurelia TaxID=43137 RepID=A0A8S1YLM5_PAROT|nr:unnamed protein product [Paramecium octaurelia]
MQFFIIIFGFRIFLLNSYAITCEVQKVQPVLASKSQFANCFILEGNEEDYYQLKSIEKEIVQKSFIIPYKDTPIQTKVFKIQDYVKIQEKLICSLFLNYQQYYITCISFDTLDFEKNNGNSKIQLKVETTISSQEICDEIHLLSESFYLICLSEFYLKLYSVSLTGDTQLINELNVSIQVQNQCNMKQEKIIQNNYFIIAFFQCSEWIIESNSSLQEFSYVDDVQVCDFFKQLIYLIEGNNYLQVRWTQNGIYYLVFKSKNLILKLILINQCTNIILATYIKENNAKLIQNFDNEVILNYPFRGEQLYYSSQLFFLQNQTEFIISIDEHLTQTYQILNSSLTFLKEDNLFYQIDKTNNLLQFYRYFPFSSIIYPKQQFLYIIQKAQKTGKQSLISCLKMQYQDEMDGKNTAKESTRILKNCQDKQKINFSNEWLQSYPQQNFSILDNQNNIINLSIWNEEKIENHCYQQLTRYKFKGKVQLISMKSLYLLVFQVENIIYFQNCQTNKIYMTVNRNQYEVYESMEDYYLVDRTNKQIKVMSEFYMRRNYVGDMHLDVEIIKVQKVNQQLIIYLKNYKYPILFSKSHFLLTDLKYRVLKLLILIFFPRISITKTLLARINTLL